ncbi:hypothetical protein SAMN06309944_2249 [Micrococcales bacterium KH10]|nr:hypothetical protein SAMN06309944_2249 [Micrococcales bacterium KH10]
MDGKGAAFTMTYDPNNPGPGPQTPSSGAGSDQPHYGPPRYGQPQPGQPQYVQPSYGQPQYGQQQFGQGGGSLPPNLGHPSSMLGMKPGIIPLRPLTLGEILDGAFQAIRRHAKITLGLTLLIVTVFITAFTALGALIMPWIRENFGGFSLGDDADLAIGSMSWFEQQGIITAGSIGMTIATIIVTGTLVYAIGQLCLGLRPSVGEIWSRVKPRLWALAGVALLTSLIVGAVVMIPVLFFSVGISTDSAALTVVGVVLTIVAILAAIVLSIMLSFASSALILEEASVITSLKRSWFLVKSQFWRVLGIQMLVYLIVSVIQQIIVVPLTILGTIVGIVMANALVWILLVTLSTVLAATIGVSYSASVIALLYVDVRMRREGLDVQLAAKASSS